MFIDPQFLIVALKSIAHVYSYCAHYQMITGIDVLSMLANNQISIETMQFIISTVNTHLLNIASEVSLTDVDLWELLKYAIQESGNTNIIRAEILQELGLYTNSIIAYLISFGYIIQ